MSCPKKAAILFPFETGNPSAIQYLYKPSANWAKYSNVQKF